MNGVGVAAAADANVRTWPASTMVLVYGRVTHTPLDPGPLHSASRGPEQGGKQ